MPDVGQLGDRLQTPPASVDAAVWTATLSAADAAYLAGAALRRVAMVMGITEAALYEDLARRAAADPDCNVVR